MSRTIRLLSFVLLALVPVSASAFIFIAGAGSSGFVKGSRPVSAAPVWPGRSLKFYVNTNISAMGGSTAVTVTGTELYQAVQAAVNAWKEACRADIDIEIIGTTSATYSPSDGTNVIMWDRRTTGEGNYYGSSTSTLAAATTVLNGAEFEDCDIVMNGNATTSITYSPASGEADLRSVLTHEIGHCLGLDHTIEATYTSANTYLTEATMVQTSTLPDPSDTTRRDINQDDRDAIECIYERGYPLRSGNRCGSYHGTNGQGVISGVQTGGPSTTDTNCGTDAQGKNARPGLDAGDGCVGSAVAGTHDGAVRGKAPYWKYLGGTWGFLFALSFAYSVLRFFRRSLRKPTAYLIPTFFLLTSFLASVNARAWDLELSVGAKKTSPSLWNTHSNMDPSSIPWDRDPSPVELTSFTEITGTAFHETETWGKWGTYLTVTLPKSTSTNAKAQNAAEQSKETSIWGFRFGPNFRYYPNNSSPDSIRWYLAGKIGLGFLFGSQTFTSSSSGSVSYRAWSTELAVGTGAEIPVAASGVKIVLEGGYSRLNSSYFASTGNSGTLYSDFPSGTRMSVDTGGTTEDLKFKASGLYAAVGIQIPFAAGKKSGESKEVPAYDDYEKPVEKTVEKTVEKPTEKSVSPDVSPVQPAPKPTAAPSPAPTAVPSSVPSVSPTSAPLQSFPAFEDPLEAEKKFQESLKPKTLPKPKKRETWEIDAPPMDTDPGVTVEPQKAPGIKVKPGETPAAPVKTSPPNQPDPVP